MNAIKGFQDEYRFLSNFYPSLFTASVGGDDVTFQWNEQYFMFHKSTDFDYQMSIVWADSPAKCKSLGKQCTLRSDWEKVKDEVMLEGLRYKFAQNLNLALQLLNTHDAYLEETNTWNDTYWGVCDGAGRNMLGLSLMRVRAELSVPGALTPYMR